jgi:hypothetical protein
VEQGDYGYQDIKLAEGNGISGKMDGCIGGNGRKWQE